MSVESVSPAVEQGEIVKLLLVDDREEDLQAMRLTLEDPGYELVLVRSGAEALRQVLQDDFAVILLDVVLPDLDGFEIARMIQGRPRSRHTPILFLTAVGADLGYIYRAYSAGAVDYLTKPIDPDVVRAKVSVFANLMRKDRRIRRQADALREAERRQKELELAELRTSSESRYRNLADAIPAIVWTADASGELVYANRLWAEYTGMQMDRTRGAGWLAAVHERDRPAVEEAWRDAVARTAELTTECRLHRKVDDAFRAHLVRVVPERGPGGELIGWLATMVDCEDLRQAIHARDEFLATASHELRTPLTTLSLQVQTMRRALKEGTPSETRRRFEKKVEAISRQTERLDRLIGALLDVTRIAAQRPIVERETCDLSRLVKDVVDRLSEEATRVGSTLVLEAGQQVTGLFDPLRIEQVVTNLVSNAIRYGAGKPIRISLEQRQDHVCVRVQDHGCGIAPEHVPKLFTRFQRISSRSHQAGLGLGLYISRHIARAHGGDISFDTQVGQGSVFTLELPN